ncbi:MAG: hypothetical protein CM15mP128_2580 [Methanobacteriota archaeon]|nr:MAG: hypothetical protein CM15mP128_2580 [Euryarchaeota archaeon]
MNQGRSQKEETVFVVADDDHGRPPTPSPGCALGFLTKAAPPHRHDLVDEKDLWFKMGGHSAVGLSCPWNRSDGLFVWSQVR